MSNSGGNLLELDLPELEAYVRGLGEPAFRGRQLWQWLWQKGAASFGEMTNLSKALRARLEAEASIGLPRIVTTRGSEDGTSKLLLELADGERIECVLIPERRHTTLCLSTQVGCAMGCLFCSTGRMGFTRNLSAGEILGQVLLARRFLAEQGLDAERPLRNVVYMGMGEPLNNLAATLKSLAVLTDSQGLDFSTRRVTVSTVGLLHGLPELGASGLASLAVSLHAPTQELRARLMPKAAAAAPLDALMAALDAYPLRPRQRITYEYILIRGLNDSAQHAKQLVRLLGQRKAKVNLIACNPAPEDSQGFEPPDEGSIEAFMAECSARGLTVLLRKSKGRDIAAACGQLKAAHG